MPARKMPNQRLRRRQTDQTRRLEFRPWTLLRRPLLNTPRRRRIDREYRNIRALHGRDGSLERIADFAREAES